GLWPLVPPRRGSRHHLRARRPVRSLRPAIPPALAVVVPRGSGASAAGGEGTAVSARQVRVLEPGDEAQVDALLAAHADSSLFLRRNLLEGLVDRAKRYHGTWAAAFEAGRVVAVAQHSRFGTMLFQAPAHVADVTRAAARARERPGGGLVGPWAQALPARA